MYLIYLYILRVQHFHSYIAESVFMINRILFLLFTGCLFWSQLRHFKKYIIYLPFLDRQRTVTARAVNKYVIKLFILVLF